MVTQPKNPAHKAGVPLVIPTFQLPSSSYVTSRDAGLGITKINIIIGKLKTSSTPFYKNTLRLATPLEFSGIYCFWSVSFSSSELTQQLKARPSRPSSHTPGSVPEARTTPVCCTDEEMDWPDWWSWQHRMPGQFQGRRAGNRWAQKGPGPWQSQRTRCWRPELQHKWEHSSKHQQETIFVHNTRVTAFKPWKNSCAD